MPFDCVSWYQHMNGHTHNDFDMRKFLRYLDSPTVISREPVSIPATHTRFRSLLTCLSATPPDQRHH